MQLLLLTYHSFTFADARLKFEMFSASDSSSIPARPGASYGHRKLQSYSVLSHTGSSEDILSLKQQADLNNKHIFKKIREWFETWRPWQQRMLVCGLTDRCPKNQLEVLATVMEPVFHRDFVAALKQRYPSAPFRKMKEMALLRERWKQERLVAQEEENVRTMMEQLPVIEKEDEDLLQELVDSCISNTDVAAEPNRSKSSRAISDFAIQYAARVIISSLRTIHPFDDEGQPLVGMIGEDQSTNISGRESLVESVEARSLPDSSRNHGSEVDKMDGTQSLHSEPNSIKESLHSSFKGSAQSSIVGSARSSIKGSPYSSVKGSVCSSDKGSAHSSYRSYASEKQRTASLKSSSDLVKENAKADILRIQQDGELPTSASARLTRSVDASSYSREAEDPLSTSTPSFDDLMQKKLDAIKPLRTLPPLKTPSTAHHRHRSAIGSSSDASTIDYFMQDTVEKLGTYNVYTSLYISWIIHLPQI
jgi:hypothetical protein